MKNYIIAGLAVLVVLLLGFDFVLAPVKTKSLGGAVLPNYATTNSSSTCGVAVATALAANSAIQARFISNTGATNVYLWPSSTSTGFTAVSGITLSPSSTLTMSDVGGSLWTGTIFCITASATDTITYAQW